MKQRYQNDVDMFGVVRDFLTTHAAQLTAVPIIATLATELSDKIAEIDAMDDVTQTPITGVAADKDVLRTDLEEAAFAVSEPLATFAFATSNLTLRDEVDATRTDLDEMEAAALDAFAGRVISGATTHLAALAPYGVTAGMITAITTARGDFAAVVNDPRSAIVERKAHTQSVPAIVRDVKTRILRGQLDRLMNRYRPTAPTLYAGYRAARVIVDRRGGGGNGGGGGPVLPPAPTGLVVSQENPGDAVALDATVAAGVTLVKFFAKPAGSSETPTLITSAAVPPTSASGVGPGDYEWTATAVSAAGESAPSAPVLFTVA